MTAPPTRFKSKLGRLILALLMALNGLPVLTAPTPTDRPIVLKAWANALGVRGPLADSDWIITIDYQGTGTIAVSDEPCLLTAYSVRLNYKLPGLRREFSCTDAHGQAHHEIHVVADRSAWNETEAGLETVSVNTRAERLVQLWSDPLALVKAAVVAGAATQITVEDGKTVVWFPVPSVAGATATATLNDRYQAERVETRLGDVVIETTYWDYAPLSQPDGREAVFPRRIVQTEGAVTLADLRITNPTNQIAAAAAEPVAQATPDAPRQRRPAEWATEAWGKLDESLRKTVERGCVVPPSIIIRTKPGYRQGLQDALKAHGSKVTGNFASINAVGASVSCKDLVTLAGFSSTLSVSVNARVTTAGQDPLVSSVSDPTTSTTVSDPTTSTTVSDPTTSTTVSDPTTSTTVSDPTTSTPVPEPTSTPVAEPPSTPVPEPTSTPDPEPTSTPDPEPTSTPAPEPTSTPAPEETLEPEVPSAPEPEVPPVPEPEVPTEPEPEAPPPPVDPGEAEGQAAALLQTPMFQTLFGDQVRQIRSAVPTNSSIGVAIIDSGIAPGIDFGDRITAFYDFTQGDAQAVAPSDEYGHGTHVAGLVASRFVGVAPHARLIGLKVLDGQGQGDSVNVLRAIEFAMMNKDALDIQVLNISLGHPIYEPAASDPMVQAVEAAVRMGLVVVVSAGNFGIKRQTGASGYAGIASPGNAPSAFSIGAVRTFNTATRDDDRMGAFSSRGPTWYDGLAKPDFSAPGQNLLSVAASGSTLRLVQEARGNVGNYMRLTGTSMAAGVASGLAALVLQANRGLTPNALKAVLGYSAINVTTENLLAQGAGAISGGAVALAQAIDPSVPVGQQWLVAGVTPETVIDGVAQPWVQRMMWGNHVARGIAVIDEQRPAWAAETVWGGGLNHDTVWIDEEGNVIWGDSLDDDDNIVWGNSLDDGDNIVWGNNIVFGYSLDDDNIVWGNALEDDNIVWGNNVVWGGGLVGMNLDDDNIVWGNNSEDDNIVWGNLSDDNILWGNLDDDNIVWGNNDDDNIVWGNSADEDGLTATPTVTGNGGFVRRRRAHEVVN